MNQKSTIIVNLSLTIYYPSTNLSLTINSPHIHADHHHDPMTRRPSRGQGDGAWEGARASDQGAGGAGRGFRNAVLESGTGHQLVGWVMNRW